MSFRPAAFRLSVVAIAAVGVLSASHPARPSHAAAQVATVSPATLHKWASASPGTLHKWASVSPATLHKWASVSPGTLHKWA